MDGGNKELKQSEILLKAIDFFTQRVHIEQIMDFGFEFLKKLLILKSSALFIRKGNEFQLKKQTGYGISSYHIFSTKKLDELPLFHGRMVTKNFHSYFPNEVIELFQIELIVPLMIDTELTGFIVAAGKNGSEFNDDDLTMVDHLMKLINYSLENNQRFLDFQKINADLDQKIFNLFVINQSTKALLSELKLDKLYAIATDVFSEITGSAVTSFGIYDPLTNKIKMSGYRNVSSYNSYYTEFEITNRKYSSNIVLHLKEDLEAIKSLFVNWEELYKLDAEYIVFIVKDEILGLVTISKSINRDFYSRSDFELIESLASTTYIAITNARLFNEIKGQKEQIEKKFDGVTKLNKLIKTINSAQTKEELLTLTLQTLQLGFRVNKAFFAERVANGEYQIIKSIGLQGTEGQSYQLPETVKSKLSDDTIYDYKASNIVNYFSNEKLVQQFGEMNGIVLSPIIFNGYIPHTKQIDGFLVVLDTKENLKNEEITVIDTITKNISPLLNHMKKFEEIKEQYLMTP